MQASRWGANAAVAALLCGCFTPGDGVTLETEDGSSEGTDTAQPSTTDPTDPSTSGPTTTDSTDPTNPTDPTDPTTTDPTDTDPTETASDTTMGDDTTGGVDPACADGSADPGELCLGMPPNALMAPQMPVDVALGDISSNGLVDIIVLARGMQDSTDIVVTLEADGVGGYVQGTTEPTPSPASRLRLGDLDNDDDLDVVVHGGDIVWLRNQGTFFLDYDIANNFSGSWEVSDIFIADLDGDGVLDVGYTEAYGRAWVQGALSNGSWVTAGSDSFPGPGEGASGMAAGPLSQDAGGDNVDVLMFNQYDSAAMFIAGNGDGSFEVGDNFQVCPGDIDGVRYGELADFNDDGMTDVVVTCMDGDGAVSLGNAGGLDTPVALPLAGAFKPAVVDIDADGDLDVLLGSTTLSRAVLFINDGAGAFELSDQQFMAPGPVYAVAAGDLNDDGATDVVVASAPQDMPGRVDVYTADP